MSVVATCVPTTCDGPTGPVTVGVPNCSIEESQNGTDDRRLQNDVPRFTGIDASEAVDAGESIGITNPDEEMLIDREDLKWLGHRSITDEDGPRLRVGTNSKVVIYDESFTVGEVLKNTDPGEFYEPSPQLKSRRFRLSDVVDVECEVLDGIFDGDDQPERVSMRLSHILREINSHVLKFLDDDSVDWQQVRLTLARRGYLLRRAEKFGISIVDASGSSPTRSFSTASGPFVVTEHRSGRDVTGAGKDCSPGSQSDDFGLGNGVSPSTASNGFISSTETPSLCSPQPVGQRDVPLHAESRASPPGLQLDGAAPVSHVNGAAPVPQVNGSTTVANGEKKQHDESDSKQRACSAVRCDWLR
eukprot:gnl/MRDRNA2_/MRDRNA2_47538_c0_seq1.p1 gnl/MRDRNA2_/MRDRNA2_47538_c0~~gnl/MRDRNA2_/MRDRNA2_47538_c0_seq1.p1  ORF type:complete len:359 (+),score=71.70 gnl/MRDRNA2_/MRDRNA2_47538_c0_seq1:100-1176(+)